MQALAERKIQREEFRRKVKARLLKHDLPMGLAAFTDDGELVGCISRDVILQDLSGALTSLQVSVGGRMLTLEPVLPNIDMIS
jgi:hypothetical protein